MPVNYVPLTPAEVAALDGLDDWRVVLRTIRAEYRAGSFTAAARLVASIADAAEAAVHHPDLEVRYPDRVAVRLTTHAAGGLTDADVSLARTISGLAAAAGARAERAAGQVTEIAIDTLDADRIRPFWAAVLDYQQVGTELHDPRRGGPSVWFQQIDEPRAGRGRIHLDVNVPEDVAAPRIAAALAAGGRMVTDQFARSWWVLADADGNEVCVCTWQDR